MKATAQMGELTRERIEQLCYELDAHTTVPEAEVLALRNLALQAIDRWVLVNERLPETHGHYLTVDDEEVEILWFQNDEETEHQPRWWRDGDSLYDSHPTHWMPLPPPPERP